MALTLGDPRGIGPEVTRKAVARFLPAGSVELLLIGPEGFETSEAAFHSVGRWSGGEAAAGAVAASAIHEAVDRAMRGEVDAVVTAPIHKPALRAAGFQATGHTEILRDLAGVDTVGMLMAAEKTRLGAPLRVLLATTHLALRDVPSALTSELLIDQGRLLHNALSSDWGIEAPRLAFCALNPHASDSGLFGDEEARIFAPAINALKAAGVDARGPLPADTVFGRALEGDFDAVVAPYHDVGMAAFKTVAFGAGVNVTVGLPFVRTSPDHGTAFDIAGRGQADESSMLEALRLAEELANRRRLAHARL